MTVDTPWQQRVISSAIFVGSCMAFCASIREKVIYVIFAAIAFSVAALTQIGWKLFQKHAHSYRRSSNG